MISKKETQEKVRNSVYWGTDTKLLVEQKSQELQLSQNKITELCLQRYLPSMQNGVKGLPISSRLREPDLFPES